MKRVGEGSTKCGRAKKGCPTLAAMVNYKPKGEVLFKQALPAWQSVAIGLCCNGKVYEVVSEDGKKKQRGYLWEFCKGYKGGVKEVPTDGASETYQTIFDSFMSNGWNLFRKKTIKNRLNLKVMRKEGPIKQVRPNRNYITWPKNFPVGDCEVLFGELVMQGEGEQYKISLSCPIDHEKGLAYRVGVSYKKGYPENIGAGEALDFDEFKIIKTKNEVEILGRRVIYMPIKDFLIALTTLKNISDLVINGPGENPPSEETETDDEEDDDEEDIKDLDEF